MRLTVLFARLSAFYQKTKWLKWVRFTCFLLFGMLLLFEGFAFLQYNPGQVSGLLIVISGLLWGLCGVFECIPRSTTLMC